MMLASLRSASHKMPSAMPRVRETVSLKLPPLASTKGGHSLADQLLSAITESVWHLPFDAACTSGAPVQDAGAVCSDLRCAFTDPHTLCGSFAYAFTEETTLGCSDQRYTDIVRGRFQFSYDRQTSLLTVDVPQIQEAEYDPEEF